MHPKTTTHRRRAFTWVELVAVLVIIGILAAILFPTFSRTNHSDPSIRCRSRLRNLGLAIGQYTQDYDGRFPPRRARVGWRDATFPYVKDAQVYQCPSAPKRKQTHWIGYWFNRQLGGVLEKTVKNAATTAMLGDGYANLSARVALASIPEIWSEDTTSPLYRHYEGMNFAFVDGHVKWFKAENARRINFEPKLQKR